MENDLFSQNVPPPLAERMRPKALGDFVGQDEVVGEGRILRRMLERGRLESSIIFWGPPGCGKTTLAHLVAGSIESHFEFFSAVTSGIAEVRRIVAEAESRLKLSGGRTILFVDEIHRFNKAQQDAFLPHIESGTIILIGATTENPSFEVISPLLSRCRVFILDQLSEDDVVSIMRRAIDDPVRGFGGRKVIVADENLHYLAHLAAGDARTALNALEMVVESLDDGSGEIALTRESIEEAAQRRNIFYDKKGEHHFNIISALHKSLRGGDPDASLYWLARMLEAGEEPLYVARMAAAPKSNALYTAYGAAAADVKEHGPLPVPLWIRNAPTRLMKDAGFGKGYEYPHDDPDAVSGQEYFPEELKGREYYHPVDRGFEREIIKRIEYWRNLREGKRKKEEK
ncbi:MAG: replication-associated recombination protein A [Candidatus Krumholzibacteria bacterium]|nr:replication-associated recombination protein A [Candidatus Krumholzibacteria bacterium]